MTAVTTNVEVTRNGTENPLGLLRRFTKRVQGSGVLPRVRGLRYHERTQSHYKRKMKTLTAIERRALYAEQVKLGKINPDAPRKRGRK